MMRKLASFLFALALLAPVAASPATAACQGVVKGLSPYYDPATGSGFLAVRAGPTTQAQQIGSLFNGNVVQILTRRGNWYNIAAPGIGVGWSYYKYIHNTCGW